MYASLATLIQPICLSFHNMPPPQNYRRNNLRGDWSSGSSPPIIVYNNLGILSDDSEDRGKRRWIRRRKREDESNIVDSENAPNDKRSNDREALVASTDNADNAEIEHSKEYNENDQPKESSACPLSSYSMTFPRYRIDKTTVLSSSSPSLKDESEKRRIRRMKLGIITKLVRPNSSSNNNEQPAFAGRIVKNDNNSPFSILSHKFGELSNFLTKNSEKSRKSVESLYQEEIQKGNFRWVSSSETNSIDYAGGVSSKNTIDADFRAAAEFWKMSSNIITHLVVDEQPPRIWYLALPETTSSVAQSLCDILNWHSNYSLQQIAKDGKRTTAYNTISIRSDLDVRYVGNKVPVVKFTVTFDSNDIRQQLEDRQEQRWLLPKADDTERRTKAWVKRLLVQLGICPFTRSENKSGQGLKDLGVPVAKIMYRHSSALGGGGGGSSDVYLLMADVWQAISDMVAAGPASVSSILLAAPGFDEDFTLWSGPVFAMLESCVGAIQGEEIIGVVCFHPQYKTPDGQSWPGFGHMHSVPRLKKWYNQYNNPEAATHQLDDDEIAAGGAWQRRTPHAVINVLRAEQLEAAEGRRRTGELYRRNIRVLVGKEEDSVGLEKLIVDLAREQCL